MGFFFAEDQASTRNPSATATMPVALMQAQGCKVCPRDLVNRAVLTPKMGAGGSARCDVYFLRSAPSMGDDAKGAPLSDEAGEYLRRMIPNRRLDACRFGNVAKCYAPAPSLAVDQQVMMCCSGFLKRDIEESKPLIIVGIGPTPLRWALGEGVQEGAWRGRIWPLKVGAHVCWYAQINDPQWVIDREKSWGGENEFTSTLRHDMARVFEVVTKNGRPPAWNTFDQIKDGIDLLEGGSGELALDQLEFYLEQAALDPCPGIDIETTALRPYAEGAVILTVAISTATHTFAFPVDHPEGYPPALRPVVKELLLNFLLNSGVKIAHNLGFELEWFCTLLTEELAVRTQWGDSMAAGFTVDERTGGGAKGRGVTSLGQMTLMAFGFNLKDLSSIDPARLLDYPLRKVLEYNALDAKWCRLLFIHLRNILERENLLPVYQRTVAAICTATLAQVKGIPVDREYARRLQEEFRGVVESAKTALSATREVKAFASRFGRTFSPASHDDCALLIRDVMGRTEGAKGPGSYSTDEDVLNSIPASAGHAPAQILLYRSGEKLLSTYIDPVMNTQDSQGKSVVWNDGLVHTNYRMLVVATGRSSADDPNVQNYPKHKYKKIRGMIVAPDGSRVVAADYGQIEARVVAMASDDPVLVDAMWTSYDIHQDWAVRVMRSFPLIKDHIVKKYALVDWDALNKAGKPIGMHTLRQEMKNMWVFPQFFGSSWRSCAVNLALPEEVAVAMQKEFWGMFKGVKRWHEKTKAGYLKNNYVETLGGRRRRGQMSVNELINAPIQGTAAEIFFGAWTRLSLASFVLDKPHLLPPLNVHDDLTTFMPDAMLEDDTDTMARIMCDCRERYINVPIVVEVSVSKRHWHELREVAVYRSDALGMHSR